MKQDSHLVASKVTACLLNSTNVNTAWEKNDPCLQGSFQNNLATKKRSQKVEREKLKWTHSSYKDFPIYLLSLFKGFYHSFWKLILEINYFLFELPTLKLWLQTYCSIIFLTTLINLAYWTKFFQEKFKNTYTILFDTYSWPTPTYVTDLMLI